MLTPEDHTKLLRSFEVDRLLKLVTLEAKRLHGGHLTIFAFTTEWKVAFGTPQVYPLHEGTAYYQLRAMPGWPTLKEALIAALVAGKDFADYFAGDGAARFAAELERTAVAPGVAAPPLVYTEEGERAWKIATQTYGSEGMEPCDPHVCPYFWKTGTASSCISGTGDSICGGVVGSTPGYVYCGLGLP